MSQPPPAAEVPVLTERQLERSMELNIAAGFLGTVWFAVAGGMPLPLLMETVKASGFQLGLLSAVRQFSMLAQLPSALIIEHLVRRKPFWAVICITQRAMWFAPALLPLVLPHRRDLWPAFLIAALGISDVFGSIGTAPWFSWLADLLPPERAGRFWGGRQRALSVAILCASFVFGVILDSFAGHGLLGFQIVFGAGAIFGVADILVHLGVYEPAPVRIVFTERPWRRIIAPLKDRNFCLLTLGMGVWTAAVTMPGYAGGLPSFFSVVYLKETFGVSYGQASWIFIASAVSAILWSPKIGRMIDHRGARRTLVWIMAVGPVFTLAWLFVSPGSIRLPGLGVAPQPVILIGAASLIVGGLYSCIGICHVRFSQALTAPSGRTIAMGVHWSLVGVIASIGALAAGWIKDHVVFGPTPLLPGLAPFSYFQVLVLIQIALAWAVAVPLILSISASGLEPDNRP